MNSIRADTLSGLFISESLATRTMALSGTQGNTYLLIFYLQVTARVYKDLTYIMLTDLTYIHVLLLIMAL